MNRLLFSKWVLSLILFVTAQHLFSQNIAINTSGTAAAATNMLEVTQTSAAANMVAVYAINSGATAGTGYGLYSTKTGAGTTNVAGYFSATGGTANYAGIFENGNVGIGTTAPSVSLHVFSSSDVQTEIRAENTNATGTTATGLLRAAADAANIFVASHGSARTLVRYGITLGGYSEITNWNGGNGLIIGTQLNKPLIFGTNNAERMRILSGGNVGIGTTTPSSLMSITTSGTELTGTAMSPGFRVMSGNLGGVAGNELCLASIGGTTGNQTALGIRSYRTVNGADWSTTAIGLGMDVDNTVRAGACIWLHANSNVGIGTTTPATKLDVEGTSGTTLKIVDGNEGAGKVLTSSASGVASWSNGPYASGSGNMVLLYNDETDATGNAATTNVKSYTVVGNFTKIKTEVDIEWNFNGAGHAYTYAILYNAVTVRTATIGATTAAAGSGISGYMSYTGAISNGQVISIDIPTKVGANIASVYHVRGFRVYGIY